MFEDPELPDFDSMSQEELIEWLEELTKMQGVSASETIDDPAPAQGQGEPVKSADETDENWRAWLDDTNVGSPAPIAEDDFPVGDSFEDADEETPVDLARFVDGERSPLDAEAMAWLAQISAAETEEELPEITDYRPPEPPPENLDELLAQGAQEDPLEWLDSLGVRKAGPRLPTSADSEPTGADEEVRADAISADDFDDAYEDDETLDDLEDESLYTQRPDKSTTVLESILGMEDRESEEYSTQSMAPVPDNVQPAPRDDLDGSDADALIAEPAAGGSAVDGLTQAFMLHDQQVDLEAWYSSRLRAIAAASDSAAQPAAIPAFEPEAAPSTPPPPGLAAAINSARGKVDANELPAALVDYETLLRTNAGLDWVISDMRRLIAQDRFRHNPSVHRVLGDALMRQGQLDAALDVYRHALTLL
ncbi:MAG: hypothetical protein OXG49_11135 [Chloroflexi bacterium]|nr:hypothetical protein [Chloroflexota bacterium]